MKLYTIKKDSTFQVSSFTFDQPEENESSTVVTTEVPIILTEDNVMYEGTCGDPECGCETVNFQLPSVRYYVDRSDVVVSEFVLSQ
jgi:hypothetical protein